MFSGLRAVIEPLSSGFRGRAWIGLAALCLVLLVGFATVDFWWNDGTPGSIAARSDAGATPEVKVPGVSLAGSSDADEALQVDCLALVNDAASSLDLASDRKWFGIRAFLNSLEDRGITVLGQRLVADLAGVRTDLALPRYPATQRGTSRVRMDRVDYSLPKTGAQHPPLTTTERKRLLEALRARDVEPLLEEFGTDPSVQRRDWPREDPFDFDEVTTVLGHAIRLRGPELYRVLGVAFEQPAFGLHEVAVSIDQGVGATDLAAILDHSEVAPDASWRDRRTPRDNTLALVAALAANPGALQLLLERGSDPSIGRRSVLDELPLPTEQAEAVQEVVHVLLAHGDRPYLPSTRAALKRWLPHPAVVPLHPDAEVEMAAHDLEGPARELASLVADWDRRIEHASWAEQHCRQAWDGEAMLSYADSGLAAKTRQQDELDRQHEITQRARLRSKQEQIQQLGSEGTRIVEAIFEAVNESRWEDAISLAERLELQAVDEHLLFRALFFGAPIDIVETLIDRAGRVLPEQSILTLASAPNERALAVAKVLHQHHGLDLHFVDGRGRNAVSETVSLFWDTRFNSVVVNENVARWLTFLAENSVAMKPDGGGLDPLDMVLLEILRRPFANRAGVRVARFLVDHGAPVGTSHRDLVEEIALADWDGYRRLVRELPELEQAPM